MFIKDTLSLQKKLIQRGFRIGAVDNDMGVKTLSSLMAVGNGVSAVNSVLIEAAGALLSTLVEYEISTRLRLIHFLAQTGHESMGFARTREIWGPTPAQLRYEGRADLGNTHPGDGKRYMGRGYLQYTGRANYAQLSASLGIDAVEDPTLLEKPLWAAKSAGLYWSTHKLNALADIDDIKTITKRINGGLNGLDDREARRTRMLRVW